MVSSRAKWWRWLKALPDALRCKIQWLLQRTKIPLKNLHYFPWARVEMQEDVEKMSCFPWAVHVRRKNESRFYALWHCWIAVLPLGPAEAAVSRGVLGPVLQAPLLQGAGTATAGRKGQVFTGANLSSCLCEELCRAPQWGLSQVVFPLADRFSCLQFEESWQLGQSCCCHWVVANLQSPNGSTKHVQRIRLRSGSDTCVAARGAGECGSLAGTSAGDNQCCCVNANRSMQKPARELAAVWNGVAALQGWGGIAGERSHSFRSLCRVLAPCECRSYLACKRRLGAVQSFVSRAIGRVVKYQSAVEHSLNDSGSRDDVVFLRKRSVKVCFGLVNRKSFQIKNFSITWHFPLALNSGMWLICSSREGWNSAKEK